MRILIVEDDVDICLALSDLLGEFGFETAVAGDGIKALEILDNADPLPKVVLLDLKMPNMNGWTFREKMKAHPRYKHIPIIVMTALTAHAAIEAEGYLRKPFELEEALQMLTARVND